MIPGMNAGALKGAQVDEKVMARTAAIIQSMTPYERENPSVLNSSRKRRIALGSGVKVEDINKLLKQFDMMNQMMKQFSGPGASRKMKRMGKLGGMGGLGGFPGLLASCQHIVSAVTDLALRNKKNSIYFWRNNHG